MFLKLPCFCHSGLGFDGLALNKKTTDITGCFKGYGKAMAEYGLSPVF